MSNTIRIIYPPHHPRSARARQKRRDRLETLLVAGALLLAAAIILSITLNTI